MKKRSAGNARIRNIHFKQILINKIHILTLSINISGQCLQESNFVEKLDLLLRQHANLPPEKLELEILENSALENISNAGDIIKRCRKMGVGFALDDFGTGHSSLSRLQQLPIQGIKIDQSFIRDMESDNSSASLVMAIVRLAHSLGIKVIAEGVETRQQTEHLDRLSCDEVQGYYFGKPMSAENFTTLIKAEVLPDSV